MSKYASLRTSLEQAVADASPVDCPVLIGLLEQIKAQAYARLVSVPSNGHDKENELLDMAQVAQLLNIPECRAYELARQGKLPAVRIGKYVRVTCEGLKKYRAQLDAQNKC